MIAESQPNLNAFHAVDQTLANLHNSGLDLRQIPNCFGGAGYCSYFSAEIDGEQVFVKTGEKVLGEIRNMRLLMAAGYNSLLPLVATGKLDCSLGEALIVPFVDHPLYGYEKVERLWTGTSSVGEFIDFQSEVLENLLPLHRIKSVSGEPLGMQHRFDLAVSKLRTREELSRRGYELLGVEPSTCLYESPLLNLPIEYWEGDKVLELPSIVQMLWDKNVQRLLEKAQTGVTCFTHGDFHSPNIVKNKDRIFIIDWANLNTCADPVWDAAKWLNYVTRFHGVISHRADTQSSLVESGILFVKENALVAKSPGEFGQTEKIKRDFLEHLGSLHGIPTDSLEASEVLGEFIVNINTLNRHLVRYPASFPLVIAAACSSYLRARDF